MCHNTTQRVDSTVCCWFLCYSIYSER